MIFSVIENHSSTQERAIEIKADGEKLGYVNRALIQTVLEWINQKGIVNAWIEKINGTSNRPAAYVYVEISAVKKF